MPIIRIAGNPVDGRRKVEEYVSCPARVRTIQRYDLVGPGDPNLLAGDEVDRTRVISSRISKAERCWFVRQAATAPAEFWSSIPANAHLRDADPDGCDGLYGYAAALFDHFRRTRPRRVDLGKISKVLHLKRPHLFPILDSRVRTVYRKRARQAAPRYTCTRRQRWAYWAAIREDLIDPGNVEALAALRAWLTQHENEAVRLVAQLSDVRLLDILTWHP